MDQKIQNLIQSTINILKKENYLVSNLINNRQSCFDIAARKKNLSFLFKITIDIDNFYEIQANELKFFSKILLTIPLLIGEKTRKGTIEDGVVYQRFQIPAINIHTLERIIKENLFPLVYAKRGGYYVKLNYELIKQLRETHQLSLKDIADELGVTRKAVYEYERGSMDSTLTTATKLEEIFDTALSIPINVLEWELGKAEFQHATLKNKLHLVVDRVLSHLGLNTFFAERAPFHILATQKPFTLFASLDNPSEKDFNDKLGAIRSLSEVMNSYYLLIVDNKKSKDEVEGVPIISREELEKIKRLEKLLEVIEENI